MKTKTFLSVIMAMVFSFFVFTGNAITASASWYSHTPATVRSGYPLTSPGRTYDGNYMGIELTGKPINGSFPGGLSVQLIIAEVPQPERYYVDFTRGSYQKLDWIPIPSGVPIKIRYTCFNCSSVRLTRVVSYSWQA